jgi:OFA family oxalate/formate antiporter-like MFS transporter
MNGMSRWTRLCFSVIALLLAGIIYAWSFLKGPLAELYGWNVNGAQLQLNYTLTLCFFCLGGVLSGFLAQRVSARIRMFVGAACVAAGFIIVSRLTGASAFLLYFGYGFLSGFGIGIVYNVVIAVTNAWFPDKKGVASGSMMLGFGFSAMVLGNLAAKLYAIEGFGWRGTFLWYGIGIGALIALIGLTVRLPKPGEVPENAVRAATDGRDFTTGEMLKRPSFWMLFTFCTIIGMVGATAIGQSRQFVTSIDENAVALAVLGASMISVMNGAGRLVVGWLFDKLGMRNTQYVASAVLVLAPVVMLVSLVVKSPMLAFIGLCICGFAYSFAPTVTATFSLAFFGRKHFALNFPVLTLTLIPASFASTIAGSLSYMTTYALLIGVAVVGAALNLFIKKA